MAGIRGVDYIDENGKRVLTGGLKARDKNLANDPDFYKKLGKLSQASWEKNGRKPRGFATMTPEKLKLVSAKGGRRK